MAFPRLLLLLISLCFFLAPIQSVDDANCLVPTAPIEQKSWLKSQNSPGMEPVPELSPNTVLLRAVLLPSWESANQLLMGGVEYEVEMALENGTYDLNWHWPKGHLDEGVNNCGNMESIAMVVATKTNKYGGFAVKIPAELLNKVDRSEQTLHVRFIVPGEVETSIKMDFQPNIRDLTESVQAFRLVNESSDKKQVAHHVIRGGDLFALNDECHKIESWKKDGNSSTWPFEFHNLLKKMAKEQEKMVAKMVRNFEIQKKQVDTLKREYLEHNFGQLLVNIQYLNNDMEIVKKKVLKGGGCFGIGC